MRSQRGAGVRDGVVLEFAVLVVSCKIHSKAGLTVFYGRHLGVTGGDYIPPTGPPPAGRLPRGRVVGAPGSCGPRAVPRRPSAPFQTFLGSSWTGWDQGGSEELRTEGFWTPEWTGDFLCKWSIVVEGLGVLGA